MSRFFYRLCGVSALFCALALLVCFWIPSWLEQYRVKAVRVTPRFASLEERQTLKLQAEVLGDPPLSVLYNELDLNGPQNFYLPPRDSVAHIFLRGLALLLAVDKPVACDADILSDPDLSSPKTAEYKLLDVGSVYPIQEPTVLFFIGWSKIGVCVAGVLFLLTAIFFKRKAVRVVQLA